MRAVLFGATLKQDLILKEAHTVAFEPQYGEGGLSFSSCRVRSQTGESRRILKEMNICGSWMKAFTKGVAGMWVHWPPLS